MVESMLNVLNKTVYDLAPVKDVDTLQAQLIEQHGKDSIVFANSFADVKMIEAMHVVLIDPIDKPFEDDNIKVIVQTHNASSVAMESSRLMNEGAKDSEVTAFTRRMFRHNQLVSNLEATIADKLVIVDTSIQDYEPLWGTQPPVQTLTQPITETVNEVKEEVAEQMIEEPVETVSDSDVQPEPIEQDKSGQEDSILVDQQDPVEEVENDKGEEEKQYLDDISTPIKAFTESTEQMLEEEIEQPLENKVVQPDTEGPEVEVTNKENPKPPEIEDPIFDPIAAAMEASIEQANQPEPEVEEDVEEEQPKGKTLEQIEDPEYPKVNFTVEISPKIFSDSKSDETGVISDFAGSHKTYGRLFDTMGNKVEYALSRKYTPKLTAVEQHIAALSEDAIANEELHKQQYVEGAKWSPFVRTETQAVPIITPIRNPDFGDAKYVGPDSVSLIQNRMKIGCKLGIYLPHTGLYFIVNSPSDEDVLNTLSIINTYRVEVLRASSGILLGSSNYYLYRQVLNLFINNVSGCSLANWNKETILGLIDERDMNIVATALQASIYPDGYEYRQVCGLVKSNKTCEHITSKLLDLRRIVFVDNSRLSESQRVVAAGGLRERSINEIKTYQETNYIGFKKAYEITEGICFVYKAQSINTAIEAGETWIKEIEQTVDAIVTFNDDEETRNNMIRQRINLTRIREFSHWVTEIQIDGETNAITERSKINELLNSLGRNPQVMEKVSDTLAEFQRLSQIAIVAIPRVPCEGCKQTDQKDLDISPHLIPQDMTSRFFTLARQRLS